ncbi:hypothetical protein ACWGDT_37285 [Streptomyces avermitilis]
MDALRLRRVNRWQAQDLAEELADLYVNSRDMSARGEYRSRQDFLNRLTGENRRPGFAMVVAETDGLVGCAFGFPVRSNGFWWLGVDGALPRSIEQLTESGSTFTLTDILVRPHSQDQDHDVACQLQERLLTDHQATLGATLVDQADQPTLASLRSWGWLDIGEVWRPAGSTRFRALAFPLGERTTARPEGPARGVWTRWPG